MNKNLHSKTQLTEFARNFDEDLKDTVLSKLVNKIYVACNSGSSDPSTSSLVAETQNDDATTNSISETSSSNSLPSNISDAAGDEKNKEEVVEYQVDTTLGRTPINVIKRISNLLAMKDKDLNDYKNTDLQKFWMPDSRARECYDCSAKFNTFRRKHHCRLCGQIFCKNCAKQIVSGKIINVREDLRVCNYCSKVVLSYLKSADISADLKSVSIFKKRKCL
jgi:1-phosphatidylinositol-3-phosphate 5-kinase